MVQWLGKLLSFIQHNLLALLLTVLHAVRRLILSYLIIIYWVISRVGPDIWGLQNREKGPKYFFEKGLFRGQNRATKTRCGEKRDFPKIFFQKGFLTPKQGSKGQKGYPAPPCISYKCQKFVFAENSFYGHVWSGWRPDSSDPVTQG